MCPLCSSDGPLRETHIVPKFILGHVRASFTDRFPPKKSNRPWRVSLGLLYDRRVVNENLLPDGPKTLGSPEECAARAGLLHAAHMRRLTALVEDIRSETGRGKNVPNFDPADGGVAARCLFLLEAPGPKAVQSGFVSRNNPDETAKNFFELAQAAG